MTELDLRLYAVLDPAQLATADPVDAAMAAVAGGATLLQLRDKGGDTRATLVLARALVAALDGPVPLLINDRVDIAHAAGADGVHLGRTDLPPRDARGILGESAIIGITIHHAADANADARVDYACLGPVYATASKDPGDPPLGPVGLAALAGATRRRLGPTPLCAIAGIDAARAPEVVASGVDGVAVIGALFRADDIAAAARALRRQVDTALAGASR